MVLPDAPLPMLSRDVEAVVRECLAKCTIAIHLLGQHYGVTPEDSSESIPALQVRLTAERAQQHESAAADLDAGERRNRRRAPARSSSSACRKIRPCTIGAEIIEGNLNLLKKDLIRRLSPPEEKPKPAASDQQQGGCDPHRSCI